MKPDTSGMETPPAPALGGPDKWHVFVDTHPTDVERYEIVRELLEEEGLTVFQRREGQTDKEALEDGVSSSRKILVLVTYSSLLVNHGLLGRPDLVEWKLSHRGPRSIVMILFAGICPSNLPEHFINPEMPRLQHSADNSYISKLVDRLRIESLPPLDSIPFELRGMGFTTAGAFFYDYLKYVLTELPEKVSLFQMPIKDTTRADSSYSIGRRSSNFNVTTSPILEETIQRRGSKDTDGIFTSRKMHIILPESYLSVLPTSCKPHSFVVFTADDATDTKQYKAIVYEITDPRDEKKYRAVMSYAPGLKTIADMCQDPLFNMTRDDYHREMHQFYFYLKELLSVRKYRHMKKNCNLVYLEDKLLAPPLDEVLIDDIKAEQADLVLEEE